MECRAGCGACCIAPSIARPFPGMPAGKPAGIPCVHLLPDFRCALFGHPDRPTVCGALQASADMCGTDRDQALAGLAQLERDTAP
ncbi:MAG: YkgJ family cysteine cluster protein [Myxococcota bacterium]